MDEASAAAGSIGAAAATVVLSTHYSQPGSVHREYIPFTTQNMDFFSKKPSTDFFFKKTEGLRSSLTEGSSKLLDSAKESKSAAGGLFGGLTSGITQISQKIGGQEQNVTSSDAAAASQGAMSQGVMPQGAMSQGAMSQGAMPQGAMSQGAMSQGAMSQGAMSQGAMSQGGATSRPGPMGSTGHGGFPIPNNSPQKHGSSVTSGGGIQQRAPQTALGSMTPQAKQPKQRVMKIHRDSDEIFEDSDADSQATEGADDLHHHMIEQDYDVNNEEMMMMYRSGSMGSELSWASSDDHLLDDISRDTREFMKSFVYKMFDPEG